MAEESSKKPSQKAICTKHNDDKKACHKEKKCAYAGSKCKALPMARNTLIGVAGVVLVLFMAIVVYMIAFR